MPFTGAEPILPVLGLAAIQAGMRVFDNLYHHEVTERLPWRESQADEQYIHAIRQFLCTGAFASFAGVTPHGALAYGLAGVLVTEMGFTLWDFVTQDRTRLLPPSERIAQTLMTLNYGALLACWLPIILNDWAALPTDLVFHNYGIFSVLNTACVGGLGLWAVRDYQSYKRLRRFAVEQLPTLNLWNPNQHILITGGTGLIGSRLTKCLLAEGHHVTMLVRDPVKAVKCLGTYASMSTLTLITTFPSPKDCQGERKERYDIVINLAGEPIAEKRWSVERKASLWESRVSLTNHLMSYLNTLPHHPRVVLSGSAIGFYGVHDSSAPSVDEGSPPIETASFSHRMVDAWEKAASSSPLFREDSIPPTEKRIEQQPPLPPPPPPPLTRLVLLRTGVVLSRDGGALAKMLTPFEFGVGGPTGVGNQIFPWIHIDDWIRAVGLCINSDRISGPVNLTAPDVVDSKAFSTALGRVLNRPAVLPLPALVLKAALGRELAEELLLNGFAIKPTRLQKAGFNFLYPKAEDALHVICHGGSRERSE